MTSPSRAPARLSSWLAAAASLVSLVSSGFGAWLGLTIGAPSLVVLLAGLRLRSRRVVSLGALGLFAGALTAGVEGAPMALVLPGVIGAVLAWDLGTTAISVGAKLGAEADTARLEFVHAGASLVVGCAAAVGAVAVYLVAPSATTPTALLVLLVAVGLLLGALRHARVGT